MVQFGICTRARETGYRLQALLLRWAELMCLDLGTARWDTLDELAVAPGAAGCALFFLDDEGWDGGHPRLAERLMLRCPGSGLVILSTSARSAIDSYALHPAGFLKKPVVYGQLAQTLERCLHLWQDGLHWLEVPSNRTTVSLPLCRLHYAEASGRNCILHFDGGQMQVSRSLGWLEPLLPSGPFLRCQKSFVVNLCAVSRFSGCEFVMLDDVAVTVGRGQRKEVERRYEDFLSLIAPEEA